MSPWVAVRICRLLGKAGRFEPAETLAGKLKDPQAQQFAWLEIVRGRLAQSKEKAESTLLTTTTIGDPEKAAAAAKGHEEVARHNAFYGQEYKSVVKSWKNGTVRPFGTAGLILGSQERSQGK